MAQTVHLRLEIDGQEIAGESSTGSLDREDTIECSSFSCGVKVPLDQASGALTGKRQHRPVVITKKIDRTTPVLLKALCEKQPVTTAEFRFFRPAIGGSGAEEHYYTVLLENGFISSVRQSSQDAITGGEQAPPMMEDVSFVFRNITWTYETGGVHFHDRIG